MPLPSAVLFLLSSVLLPKVALAWETDQFSAREEPLQDVSAEIGLMLDAVLQDAIQATNARTRCSEDTDTTRRILAREIRDRTAKTRTMPERGLFRRLGFCEYSRMVERAPLDRREFDLHEGIYRQVRLLDGLVLRFGGACSTIRIGDYLIGTDKLHHFFDEGYHYYKLSREGAHPELAMRWGTANEATITGLWSSTSLSYADLRADWAGYTFYLGLLDPGSLLVPNPEGCVSQVRPWDWNEWVDWRWDELYNPCVYGRRVQKALARELAPEQEQVCALLAEHPPDVAVAYGVHHDPYAAGPQPLRYNPYIEAAGCPETPKHASAPAER